MAATATGPMPIAGGFTHPEECEGKMHAGSSPTPIGPLYALPSRQRAIGDISPGLSTTGRHQLDYRLPRLAAGQCEDFEDAYIGRRAAEWIATVPDDFPWHYFVSFVGPHDPFDPPSEYGDRYRDAAMPPAIRRLPRWQARVD